MAKLIFLIIFYNHTVLQLFTISIKFHQLVAYLYSF